jgi:isocitrate dehydrogenase
MAPLLEGEIIDATFMSKKMLLSFLEKSIQEANDQNILFSLHMKATMMKVSDPIIFGHAVSVYFRDVVEKYKETFSDLGVNLNNGFGNLLSSIQSLPKDQQDSIEA